MTIAKLTGFHHKGFATRRGARPHDQGRARARRKRTTGLNSPIPSSHVVDALDFRIIRELLWKPGDVTQATRGIQRPWDIARKLGVHGNTVKARLDALKEAGVLRGVLCTPTPHGLGLHVGMFHFRYPDLRAKRAGIPILQESGCVTDTHDFVGEDVWAAVTAHVDERLEDRARLLARASGASESRVLYECAGGHVPARALSRLDYLILDALLDDASRPLSDVANELGVTLKTVRSRFNALTDGNALAMVPAIVPGAVNGLIIFTLLVTYHEDADDAARGRFLATYPNVIACANPSYENGYAHLVTESFRGVEDDLLRAQDDPAVKDACVLFPRDSWHDTTPYHRAIRARLDAYAPPLRDNPS
jgi:DNA-binding Lrp family transcriptional regulator